MQAGAGDLVFGRAPGVPFTPNAVRSRTLKRWRAAGAEPIGFHECRHTYASLCIAAGVNAKALSAYIGHASITITLDRYGHLMPGSEEQAVTLLDGDLAGDGCASNAPVRVARPGQSRTITD